MSRSRLEESRLRFEQSLREIQGALGSELGGGRGRGLSWVIPIAGLAAGAVLAWKLVGRRRRRKRLPVRRHSVDG